MQPEALDTKSRETRVQAQRMSRKRFKISARQAKRHAKLTLREERASKNQSPSIH